MRYQAGDSVYVRVDLSIGKRYYMDGYKPTAHQARDNEWNVATREMVLFAGRCVTIKSIEYSQYTIVEDDGGYFWTDEMFDGSPSDDSDFEAASISMLAAFLGV